MKCYEFFGCERKDCSIFKKGGEQECWEVKRAEKADGEPALHLGRNAKLVCCEKCLYYEYKNKPVISNLKELLVGLVSL